MKDDAYQCSLQYYLESWQKKMVRRQKSSCGKIKTPRAATIECFDRLVCRGCCPCFYVPRLLWLSPRSQWSLFCILFLNSKCLSPPKIPQIKKKLKTQEMRANRYIQVHIGILTHSNYSTLLFCDEFWKLKIYHTFNYSNLERCLVV